ncbi:hypothetical protein [Psychroflexus planctonicus]|uniref:Phenylalanyl-tRNA synthetase subunit alpha n=1 Tax=Psychroflexus planctonicus TaxID=1526575 RepID=A0ABQ1SJT5_9FLAO|nr:hypothetical protein [Psychroflexus planctonicus]GGE40421.1 hypothetical protein GCM10010832_20690 [Psychroflexus planctonicus]
MKKDISIPEVKDVFVAAVYAYNPAFKVKEWNVYLINNQQEAIETILVVSKGKSSKKSTSILRKKLDVLPAKSYAKLEFIQEEVLALENQFQVSFFQGNQLLDKTFIFKPKQIQEKNLTEIPLLKDKGVLAE